MVQMTVQMIDSQSRERERAEERIGEMSKKVEKEKNARIEGEHKFDQVRSC